MTGSGADNQFNKQVCDLNHQLIKEEILNFRAESREADQRAEKRMDKIESKFNAMVMFFLAAVGGIISPIVVDLIKKLITLPK